MTEASENSGIKRRGFASMSVERRREIASMGGKSVPDHKRPFALSRDLAAAAGQKGGKALRLPRTKRGDEA